jgi:diguanylate cyclase (GGDEF)-like protein
LAEIALLFRTLLEKRGGCYRTGGDEFAVLLPNHSLAEAEALAKRICTLVSESRFEGKTDHIKITATASIASLPETALDSEQMIKDADLTLYKAKHDGGNRAYVCLKR